MMSSQSEIADARDEVLRTRAQIAATLAEVKGRGTGAVHAVTDKLNVMEGVRSNPWWALAAAVGAGVLIERSQADAKVATSAAKKARELGAAGVASARHAPSRTKGLITGALDGVAARLALSFIATLRAHDEPSKATSLATRPQHSVGATSATTPVHERAPTHI